MIRIAILIHFALLVVGDQGSSQSMAQSEVVLKGQTSCVNSVSFSPKGPLLASGSGKFVGLLQESRPGKTIVWLKIPDSMSRVLIGGHEDGVSCVLFAPDGQLLVTAGYDGIIKYWGVAKWQEVATLRCSGAVLAIGFSPHGDFLASGTWGGNVEGSEHNVIIWDSKTHTRVATLTPHTSGVASLSFSANGRWLATGDMDGIVRIWNVSSWTSVTTLQLPSDSRVCSLAFSPDSTLLAAGIGSIGVKEPGKLAFWFCDGWTKVAILEADKEAVSGVAFSPDGKILASCGGSGSILLWDVERRKKFQNLKHGTSSVNTIQFSPDGNFLASGDASGTVRIWKSESWQ